MAPSLVDAHRAVQGAVETVDETRAAWLRANGRDASSELVLPATAMRLAQRGGRAVRTEDDQRSIHRDDRRLVATSFWRRRRRDAQGRLHALA